MAGKKKTKKGVKKPPSTGPCKHKNAIRAAGNRSEARWCPECGAVRKTEASRWMSPRPGARSTERTTRSTERKVTTRRRRATTPVTSESTAATVLQ